MLRKLRITIDGLAPIILNNNTLADPAHEWAIERQAITDKKKKKTEADYVRLAEIDWYGSMYSDNGKVVIPGDNIEKMLHEGGMKVRKGPQFLAGVTSPGNWPLIYDGPKNIDKLYEDDRFRFRTLCKINKVPVIKVRPRFASWSLVFEVHFWDDVLSEKDVTTSVETAGRIVGLCDWRPKHGRFEVREIESIE